ncbi:nucleotidyltransferase family protein [Dyella sp.]|uniref:nucleotidyltransferase family protein n=1 Tax=Dyella sp. TaxID=1869338 RepID=UPI003F7DF7E8
MNASSPVIVLLAAGEASRFGSLKQLAMIDGEPMVRRAARQALACGVPVLAVLGAGAERVAGALADLPLQTVIHDGWRDGLGSSLAAGVRAVQHAQPQASGVLVMLADQPRLGKALLGHLLDEHARSPGKIIATAQSGGAGPPALFPRSDYEVLAQARGAQGAKCWLRQEHARVLEVDPAPYGADLADIDTPDDLHRASAAP